MSNVNALVARLEIVPIREVFKREAYHFTTWLEEHIEALAERLGLELSVIQREKEVGDFNVDLLCEDKMGKPVIVENQLERSDHDHLGKILTYMVNLEASTAIWVTPEPRAEHEKVIEWLNESTPKGISFYLVKVEAARIAESPCAPLFTILAGPDSQSKDIGLGKKEWAERHYKRENFWTSLLERSRERTKLFANKSISKDHWLTISAGKSGLSLSYLIHMNDGGFELYIDFGSEETARNKAYFDALFEQKVQIETEFGEPLEWLRLDDKRASRIVRLYMTGGLSMEETWPSLQDQMIDGMIRFDKVMRGRLAKITI